MVLRPYSECDLSKLQHYTLLEEQYSLTMMPLDSVAICNVDASRHPVVLEDDGEIVTFFNLHEKEGVAPYSTTGDTILLRAFSTNAMHQRKGYAKKALQSLPSYLNEHFPYITTIYLTVYLFNDSAKNLYEKIGFVDTGAREIRSGRELMVMKWEISK
ncbi:GNAT family N-acetyltransferase [Rummeliibacillus pycnus]|uniref:GNAT family N-acetyltransferase n=1 Tax=Rummeliibacillus pycnus TaxID=101070 RepID=UPI0037C5D3E9